MKKTKELQQLPNATMTMVLGICSIVLCCVGLVTGIIALAISQKDQKLLEENPDGYSNAQQHKTGRLCAIIGIGVQALFTIGYIIYWIFIVGMIASF